MITEMHKQKFTIWKAPREILLEMGVVTT